MTDAEITTLCAAALQAARVSYADHPLSKETLDDMTAEMEDYVRGSGLLMAVSYRVTDERVLFNFTPRQSVRDTAFDSSVDLR